MPIFRRAAFLDRDGVINQDRGYVGRAEDFVLLPGVPEALELLASHDHALVVVTNQSGIGRGYFTEQDYHRTDERMREVLRVTGIRLDAVLYCPHLPEEGCACRKPAPGMILTGLAAVGADASKSVMFGDKSSDMAAGRAAGLGQCWLVGPELTAIQCGAVGSGSTLLDCVRHYCQQTGWP